MIAFDVCFERVIGNEGGFQKDPNDRGNWTSGKVGKGLLKGTKYGISAMTYPDIDIENLTLDQAKQIYKTDWWDSLKMNLLQPAIAYQMFDAAINHGMGEAAKMLQRAIGVKDDGKIGPVTCAKVFSLNINDVLLNFLAERLQFMSNVKTWDIYGKGWARRISHNLKMAAKDNVEFDSGK